MNSLKDNQEQPAIYKYSFIKKTGSYLLGIAVVGYMLLALISLTSCSSDDSPAPQEEVVVEVPPTLTLETGSEDITYGIVGNPENGALRHSIKALSPDGFKSLVISKVIDGTASEYETIDKDHSDYVDGKTDYIYNLNYNLSETDLGHKVSFKAVATDVNNKTAVLEFADARTELKMIKSEITLETIVPFNGSKTRPFYLYLNSNNVGAIGYNAIKDSGKSIIAVFCQNKNDGYYLGSPNVAFPTEIVEGFTTTASTKFKPAKDTPYELALDSEYDIFDAHNIKDKYNALGFNSHEEKAVNINKPGLRYFFKTDDGRTGVFQVKVAETLGQLSVLQIKILTTSLVD